MLPRSNQWVMLLLTKSLVGPGMPLHCHQAALLTWGATKGCSWRHEARSHLQATSKQ